MNCRKGRYDKANCYPHWDNYPCWVKREGTCYNKKGDTQYLDPTGLSDVLRYLSNIVGYVYNAFVTTITNSDASESDRHHAQTYFYEFLHDYTTSIAPLQNPTLQLVDYGRYYNADEYLEKAEDAVVALHDKIKNMRSSGNVQNAVQDLNANNELPGFAGYMQRAHKKIQDEKKKKTKTNTKTNRGKRRVKTKRKS